MYEADGSESEAQEIDFDVAERREMDASAGDGYGDDDDDKLREMIDEGDQMSDVEADADTLGSAGMGEDEYYNGYCYNDEGF